MAAIKLTSSGNAVQFIDEEGNVFMTSKAYLTSLLSGTLKRGFIIPRLMPFGVNKNRFPKSELWIPDNLNKEYVEEQKLRKENLKNNNDALSIKFKKDTEDRSKYQGSDDVWD